jgi:hypothetical protein
MLNLLLVLGGPNKPRTIFSLHNVKVKGTSERADLKAGDGFLETLDRLMVEKKYLPEQILNMVEILFWKWMSERIWQRSQINASFQGF